jgi:hypothetical protein
MCFRWDPVVSVWEAFLLKHEDKTRNRNRKWNTCELVCKTRALELHSYRERLLSQQKSNTQSLVLATVGGVAMVGGAAFTVASTPAVSAIGRAMYFCGVAAELVGLGGFLKTA